jgi:gas vesicle protein
MPKTRTLVAVALVPLLLFLVSCGGSKKDSSSTSTQPTASDSGSSSSNDSNAAPTATTDTSGNDSSNSSSNDDLNAADVLKNCPELAGVVQAFSTGAFANPSSGDSAPNLDDAVKAFQDAAKNSPKEIKADMQTLADGFAKFASTLKDLGVDLSNPATFASLTADQQAKLQDAVSAFDTDAFQQASDNAQAYFEQHCSS